MTGTPVLATVRERAWWTERLIGAGISAPSAAPLAALFVRCADTLRGRGTSLQTPVCAWFVPGRIEGLGKHTDYAGGRSLLCAVERGFCIIAVARGDARVVLHDVAGASADITLDPTAAAPPAGWMIYPYAVATRMARDFPAARRGADIAFASNLPAAAGLSSSSAFVTAVFLVLGAINRIDESAAYRGHIDGPEALADYLGAVENGRAYGTLPGGAGVGTLGGSEDHVAILCARPGALVQYAFRPVRRERAVPLPARTTFVVAASGVTAEKSGAARAAYNRLSERAAVLERLWQRATGDTSALGAALIASPAAYEELRSMVARHSDMAPSELQALRDRLDQFAAETLEIIPAAGDALQRGDANGFGEQVARSQQLAESLLGNQIDETRWLVRSARTHGAVAASAFGAGFGGSVWALIGEADADRFVARWRADYLEQFPRHRTAADFALAQAGRGAVRIA